MSRPHIPKFEIFLDRSELRDCWLATGYHGLGWIGTLTTRLLVEAALDCSVARRIGYALSRYMPPFVEVLPDATCGFPYEFYKIGDNFVALLIRMQPILEEQYTCAAALAELAKESGARGFVLLGGIEISAFREQEPSIVYVTNRPFRSLNNAISLDGIRKAPAGIVVSGGLALILAYAEHAGIPAIALFAPTRRGVQDFQSAFELARLVVRLFKLPITEDALRRRVDIFTKMQEIAQEIERISEKEKERREELSQLFT